MSNQDFILALHRQLITLGVAVHRDSLETAVANALRTAGTTVEQGWQPIETAPRSCIDGYCSFNCSFYRVHWYGGKWCEVGTNYALPVPLTHWRPLPARPGGKP